MVKSTKTRWLFLACYGIAVALAVAGLAGLLLPRADAQNAGQVQYTPTGTELVQIYPANTAAVVYVPLSSLRDGVQGIYSVPLTGFTLLMTAEQSVATLNPAGTLATGTVTLPPTLADGKIATIYSSQTITALTINTSNGATFAPAAPTTLAANASVSFWYDKALNQWHRFQ